MLASYLEPGLVDATLPCGMTSVRLAVQAGKPESVRWLIRRGATLDVVSAWDLGWKETARELLTREPDLANFRVGKGRLTPLHEAVLRDDVELASLILCASPDLELRDRDFDSTPLGWAGHLERGRIHALIKQQLNC